MSDISSLNMIVSSHRKKTPLDIKWFDFIYEVKRLSKEYLYVNEVNEFGEETGVVWDAHFLTKDNTLQLAETRFIHSDGKLKFLTQEEISNIVGGPMLFMVPHDTWDDIIAVSNVNFSWLDTKNGCLKVIGWMHSKTMPAAVNIDGVIKGSFQEEEVRRLSTKIGLWDPDFMSPYDPPIYENASV